MPLSLFALDKFVAQELSQLSECRAAPVSSDFPDYQSWLNMFVLNSVFRIPVPQDKAALAFALIRRAEAAIADYENGRNDLTAMVAGEKDISLYFRSLRHFEATVAVLYQGFDFARRAIGEILFKQGDGSLYERLNIVYNTTKHQDPQVLPAGHLHPVWIRNEGLATHRGTLTFDELRELVCRLSRIADCLAKGEMPT